MNINPVRRKNERRRLIGAVAAAVLLTLPAGLSAGEQKQAAGMTEKVTINIQASCPQIAGLDPDNDL